MGWFDGGNGVWFGRARRATVAAAGDTGLRITELDGRTTLVDVAALDWLSFLQVGDDTAAVTPGIAWEGWWLLGRPGAALAVRDQCSTIDDLLRDGPLVAVADRIADKTLVFAADRPRALRGRGARGGVVHLAGSAATLRVGGESVRSVRDLPVVR